LLLLLQVQEAMYGQAAGGFFGYSHLTGGYQGGQADFVRVPYGEAAAAAAAAAAAGLGGSISSSRVGRRHQQQQGWAAAAAAIGSGGREMQESA
jgi:threonine dehydrogenase-like Zn-dependent dehydrogenase